MVTAIYIGSDRLDLYKDENINLKSSIADVSDIEKNTTDFTQSFNVPATNTNNNIFKHYYDANIEGGFDARTKVDGKIQLDLIDFKQGKFTLNGVSIKNGNPSSYNINFTGNLISLKDLLKDDELSVLDLSAYDHEYSSDNILTGLKSSLFSGALVYNLIAKKRYYYNDAPSDNTQSLTIANIAYGGGSSVGVVWDDLSPSLRLIKIIEAIETKYSVSFSRDFFGRSEFSNLFLWLNNDAVGKVGGGSQVVDFDGGNNTYMNLTTNIGTYYIDYNTTTSLSFSISPSLNYINSNYTINFYLNGVLNSSTSATGNKFVFNYLSANNGIPIANNTVYYEIVSEGVFQYTASLRQQRSQWNGVAYIQIADVTTTASLNTISSTLKISSNTPKIKTIDFLKGIFKAFKLVVIPQNDGSLYVNTLNDYYASGSVINITDFVDANNYEVNRGSLLNQINFGFEEPTTILNLEYKKNNSIAYGDENTYLYDDNGSLLDGESYDYKLPFEQVVYERLTDTATNTTTNIQVASIIDETLAAVNPKAHIFYNINTPLAGNEIAFRDDINVKNLISTNINVPSHSIDFDAKQYNFLFAEEYSTWDGVVLSNNLYTNYHKNYIDSVFNIKRRDFSFKASNFPLRLLTEIELNDVIQIKHDYYRIDNFNTNLLTGSIEFNLINSFDNNINGFYPSQTFLTANYLEQTLTIYVVGLNNYSVNKTDLGFGTSWVTVTNTGSILNFAFDANSDGSGDTRFMTVTITNTTTLQEFDIQITQTGVYAPTLEFDDFRNSQYIIYI